MTGLGWGVSPCADCGVDVMPCTHKRGCRHIGRWEYNYMVHDDLWREAGDVKGYLCVACIEARLQRQITADDLTAWPINDPSRWDTPRLAARKARRQPPL